MSKEPFGRELLIDLYGVSAEKCDSLEFNYRFSEELVRFLGMEIFAGPLVFHGGVDGKTGIELYPDKAGVTCVTCLITSSLVIHTIKDKGYVSIDVYTCGELCQDGVEKFIRDRWEPTDYESQYLERGLKYHN